MCEMLPGEFLFFFPFAFHTSLLRTDLFMIIFDFTSLKTQSLVQIICVTLCENIAEKGWAKLLYNLI